MLVHMLHVARSASTGGVLNGDANAAHRGCGVVGWVDPQAQGRPAHCLGLNAPVPAGPKYHRKQYSGHPASSGPISATVRLGGGKVTSARRSATYRVFPPLPGGET